MPGRRPVRPFASARQSSGGRAFSLIELLAVIVIISILAGIAINGMGAVRKRTAAARCKAELATLATALEDYKRHYGDYPQLGEFAHASITPVSNAAPGVNTAEAKLFNCLTGVFGPKAFSTDDRLNGPNFLQGSRFLNTNSGSLNGTLATTFLVPQPNAPKPPFKVEQNVSLVDPFGNRYLYYYKVRTNAAVWQAPGYLLFSVGPDGAHTAPAIATGLYTTTQLAAANNGDNIYANR
jgi:prepilin-type N-terminal cleavage/methylation domain-containing protein